LITTLAALSREANFSVGCYCADETMCHRRLLRGLLLDAGAVVVDVKKSKEARP
jgi:CO dehydrogenase nickel-insertion accessory protein CooC1